MGFKGSLESINLADIFQNLAMNQQTGTLKVSDKNRAKCIFFERGEVRYLSHGKRKNALLGEMLVGRGLATREQVDAALAEQRQSNRLLGEIVVDLQICSKDDVDDLVRFQIEEEIYDLFGWEHAEFEFTEGPPQKDLFDAEQQATELSINTSSLIMEAARRIDEWERIRHLIPSTSEVFVRSVDSLQADASPVAVRLLSFLDGARDVDAIVEDSHFSRFEVASSLAAMLEAGQVRQAGIDDLTAGAARCMQDELPARAIRLMEQALALGADDPVLRDQLAQACGMLGEKEKAAIHLSVLGDEKVEGGDQEGAAAAYERILALLPHHAGAHEKLAKLSADRGDNETALKHYTSLVQALIDMARLDEASSKCREGLALDANNIELRSALAKILNSSGEKAKAIEEFERLAEILNRAGQVRPAADVFRRILQIDPGNKHAKRRLNSLLAGAGMKRESHAVRNASILFFVLMLAGAAYLAVHEFYALNEKEDALRLSRELLDKDEFDGAREALEPVEKNWSLFDHAASARQQRDLIKQREDAVRARNRALQEEAEAEISKKLGLAHDKRKAYEFDEASALYTEVSTSQHATADMRATASAELKKIADEKKAVDDFLEWKKRVSKADDLSMLQNEYRRTMEMRSRYADNPRLKELDLPVRVETVPAGARVLVDRAELGRAPVVIRYPVNELPHVGVRLTGYASVERVDIPTEARVVVKLKRAISWRYDAGSPVQSMALGPKRSLLVATRDGNLSAVDLAKQSREVTRGHTFLLPTGEPLIGIISGLSVYGSQVYFGTTSVYSLDLTEGIQRRWVTPVLGRVLAPVTTGKLRLVAFSDFVFGTCVDARGTGAVWAIESNSGKVTWRVQPSDTKAGTRARPLFKGTKVFVPFGDGRVYALEAANGNKAETWSIGARTTASSLVENGGLAWVATGEGKVHGLDLEAAGSPKKTFDSGWPITTQLFIDEGIAYFGDEHGNLNAVKLEDMSRPWEAFTGDGVVIGAVAVAPSIVYFGTSSGWVFAVDRATGKLSWKYSIGPEVLAGVVFEGRYLCAGAADGFVYAFDELKVPEGQ